MRQSIMHCWMLSFLCLPGQWTGGRKCGCVKMSTHSTPHRSYQSKQSSYCILEHLEIAFQPWKPVSKLKPQLALSPVGKGWNRILYIHGHRVALWPGGDQQPPSPHSNTMEKPPFGSNRILPTEMQFLKSSSIRAQFTLRRQTSDQRRPCKPHSNKGPPPTRAGRKKLKDDTKLLWNISLTLRIRGSNRGKFAALTSIY